MTADPDSSAEALFRLVGSRVKSVTCNAAGELTLLTDRGEFLVGKDEAGEIALYEIKRTVREQP